MNSIFLPLVLLFFGTSGRAESDNFELAKQALGIIGADVPVTSRKCASCHGLSSGLIKKWAQSSVKTESCLNSWSSDQGTTQALKILECIGYKIDGEPTLTPADLGLFAARMEDVRWPAIFNAAFSDGERKFRLLKSRVGMPMGGGLGFSDEDWEVISAWAQKGLPYLDFLLGGEEDTPKKCEPFVSKELMSYLKERQSKSWKTKNQSRRLLNWSCANNDSPESCFKQSRRGMDTFPESKDKSFSKDWTIRRVADLGHQTSFWMRVSPDGRFVASGLAESVYRNDTSYGSMIFDMDPMLRSGGTFREVPVAASFDPSFFPDQSGFVFQSPNMICPVSLLKRSDVSTISSRSAGCASGDMSFYHSVGSSLEGGRYLAFSGQFKADDGEGERDESSWPKNGEFTFELFQFDGQKFISKEQVPFEVTGMGDAILSPSTDLLLSRVLGVEGEGQDQRHGQIGYRLDKVRWDKQNKVKLEPMGMICAHGAKGAFSYDERFVAFHRYDNKGSSDIFVTDLFENKTYQVTNMRAGERALYPNFRSDGWLYFFVKSKQQSNSELYVSDVTLKIALKNAKVRSN